MVGDKCVAFAHRGSCYGTPPPGVFVQRVRNCLKRREIVFREAQKSAQEYENKGAQPNNRLRQVTVEEKDDLGRVALQAGR